MDGRTFEFLESVDFEAAITRASGDHDRAGLDALAGLELNSAWRVATLERRGFVGDGDFDAELLRLAERAAHQRHAGNPGRKAEVIFDPRGSASLAAERPAVDRQHRQAL